MNFSTDSDNTVFIKILESVITNVRDVSCDLFRSELGVSCFYFVFFYMDGCVHVFTNKSFVKKYGILVVVTFPGHEADEGILTE